MTVGQLIASIGSGEGAPAAAPEAKPQEQELPFLSSMADPKSMAAPSRAAPPPPPVPHLRTAPPPPYHAAPAAGAAAAAAAGKRKPLIRFPPRRTEGGDRISEMPAAQAQAYLEGGCAGSVGRAAGSGRRCLGRLFGQAASVGWAGLGRRCLWKWDRLRGWVLVCVLGVWCKDWIAQRGRAVCCRAGLLDGSGLSSRPLPSCLEPAARALAKTPA